MDKNKIETTTGVVLAGGASTRMGRDKATLTINGVTLLDRTIAVLGECFARTMIIREDDRPGLGPIGGIITALGKIETDVMFVVACDMPFLDATLIQAIVSEWNDESAVVIELDGKFEPLHAIYSRRARPVIERQIAMGDYSLQRLVTKLEKRVLGKDFLDQRAGWKEALRNVNTLEEWRQVLRGTMN